MYSVHYLRGNSTRISMAMVMRKSNKASLYISCPTRVSQHWVAAARQTDIAWVVKKIEDDATWLIPVLYCR